MWRCNGGPSIEISIGARLHTDKRSCADSILKEAVVRHRKRFGAVCDEIFPVRSDYILTRGPVMMKC